MNYGKGLRVVRAARGVSQRALAEKTSLNANYISLVEGGQRGLSTDVLERLCAALDVPVYLVALLGSDAEDLRGVNAAQAETLGRQLLAVLMSAQAHDAAKGSANG